MYKYLLKLEASANKKTLSIVIDRDKTKNKHYEQTLSFFKRK
jgi:hypothetical protein